MKTILLVDSDLGFAFWLGHALDQAGYDALPARSVADAVSLLEELKIAVDLLVIRASLPSAAVLAGDLRQQFGSNVKVIAIQDEGPLSEPLLWADVETPRPRLIDETSRMALVHTVRMVMLERTLRSC